jgi:hypothetical protein
VNEIIEIVMAVLLTWLAMTFLGMLILGKWFGRP